MKERFLGGYSLKWWKKIKKNRVLIQRYNTMSPTRLWKKYLLLRKILAQADQTTRIEAPFFCDYGKNIRVGKNFFANYNLTILDVAPITFGDRVIIGPNVTLCAAAHPIHPQSRFYIDRFPALAAPITIGDDVWIGAHVTILSGVTIGSGSVIGAGSVVTGDVPPGVVAAGTPCRVLREITEGDKHEWQSENKRGG